MPDQLLDRETVVRGDAFEDAGDRADFDRMVIRNRLVVFAVALSAALAVPALAALQPGVKAPDFASTACRMETARLPLSAPNPRSSS